MKKLWNWIKKYGGWLLAGLVTLLAIFFTLFSRKKAVSKPDKVKKLEESIRETENKIHFLKGKKERLKHDYYENRQEIEEVDKKLKELEGAVSLRKGKVKNNTMKENLDRFEDLGY